MVGRILKYSSDLSNLEKKYISIFGAPINGLRIRARRVLPLVNKKYKNIMDAGCGPGVFSFEIAKKAPDSKVTGFDIDTQQLALNKEIAEKVGVTNCSFEYQDLCNMEIHNRFDLIISVDNLEHIEDDVDALRRFYNALEENGEIILHVPGYFRRWYFFGWEVNFDVEGHFRPGYTKEQINEKFEQVGFKIIESYYTYGWFETISNNISYWITGAQMKNKMLYALAFPVLNVFAYIGKNSRPKKGAGVLVIAKKTENS